MVNLKRWRMWPWLWASCAEIEYSATPDSMAAHARDNNDQDIAAILERLKDRDYRDAADVARGFGEVKKRNDT